MGVSINHDVRSIIKMSIHILLEGTPDWLDVEEMKAGITEVIPSVEDIHHVHAWSLTSERPMITLHARIKNRTKWRLRRPMAS